jgi:hypothetical protein
MSGKKVVIVISCIALLGGSAGIALAWKMYGLIRTTPPPLPSPDRTMFLVQSVTDSRGEEKTHMRVAFEIRDARTQRVLFSRQTRASALRKWDLNWMGNDRVTLFSWEVGRLNWSRNPDGTWSDDPNNNDRVWPPVTTQPAGPLGQTAP